MENFRLSRGLCKVVGDALVGSHQALDALFVSAGAPGEPPDLAHHSKWKEWLFRAGQDAEVDSLAVLGNVLEEFMDAPPLEEEAQEHWENQKGLVNSALEADELRYFRGGRVLPNGLQANEQATQDQVSPKKLMPGSIDELLRVLVTGLPRAIYPLHHRRKGSQNLTFQSEYDIQDLLHSLLRPWVGDVRPEEVTPSYAGSSTRMDFLLPKHLTVIETKLVRSRAHGAKIGDELIIDIDHYRTHPECKHLWCVIYDPNHFIQNIDGLKDDLEGESTNDKGTVRTTVVVV